MTIQLTNRFISPEDHLTDQASESQTISNSVKEELERLKVRMGEMSVNNHASVPLKIVGVDDVLTGAVSQRESKEFYFGGKLWRSFDGPFI